MDITGLNQERLTFTNGNTFQPYWCTGTNIGINDADRNNSLLELQVFPNPISSQSTIKYSLETKSIIKLTITDSSGKLIYTLVNEKQQKGKHEIIWDGTNNSGTRVPPGIYYCCLKTEVEDQYIKLIFTN